jgi:hypothetical protein
MQVCRARRASAHAASRSVATRANTARVHVGGALMQILSSEHGATLAATLLLLAGIAVLRLAWLRARARLLVLAGWVLVGAALAGYGHAGGAETGTALGLLAFSGVAYLIVASGVEMRVARVRPGREVALEPEERPTNWSRGAAKSFLAVVLAGVAAVGIGVAFAVAMPLAPTERIVIGGLMVPILWGGGMAWTLSDAKLVRATLLLTLVSAAAYAIAFLPKMLGA